MDISYYKKYEPIFGKWHIVRELGEGSFGKVFEIERRDFGGTYKAALKAITIPQSQSEVKDILASGMDEQSVTSYFKGFVEEMIAEFVLMSKLKGHSNIVSYEDHDVIQHAEGIGWDIFIRMELLTPLLDYTRKNDLSRSDVIKLGIDICRALEVCRKSNIIHRDIKPQNIFISDLGDFKLGDFGIARTVEKTMGGLSKKGTYHYMAPEVYKSEPYGASVDIYSLGIVLYRFMNNSRLPFFPTFPAPIRFTDSDTALARRMAGEAVPSPANADEELAKVILKACAYSPKDRYLNPYDMRRDLEALLDGRSVDVSSSEKTVGVFGGTAKVDAPAAEPTDVKEPEPPSKTAAFFAEPLPTASTVGTVGIFTGSKTALKGETVGIFNSGKASNTEQKAAAFDKAENPPKRQAPRSFTLAGEGDKKALMDAIKCADIASVSQLLAKGVDPNCERTLDNGNLCSALYESISHFPNDAIAKLLIEAGADVDYAATISGSKVPVLTAAIHAGNVKIFEYLLRNGADPNRERILDDGSRYSPLIDSISVWPNDEIAKLLIDAGADVNYIGTPKGVKFPVLHAAINNGNVRMLEVLLNKGASLTCERILADGNRYSPLLDSILVWPNDEIASILINAGADVNYIGSVSGVRLPVLSGAICEGNVRMVERLLHMGADPNCERVLADGSRYSALRDSATVWPNAEITKLLIEAGADVNYVGLQGNNKIPVLCGAIHKGDAAIIKLLLGNGADPNCRRIFDDGDFSSALIDSIAVWPNAEIAKLLIEAGADVNYVGLMDGAKIPVLSAAISCGKVETVKLLLGKGADPNAERTLKNGNRCSALGDSIAVYPNNDIAKLLISAGANVNYVEQNGNFRIPVLSSAVNKGNAEMVAHLLSYGADPNAERVKSDGTLRYLALRDCIVECPNNAIMTMLINAGADVNCVEKNYNSETPLLAEAIWTGSADLVAFLLSRGANPCREIIFNDKSRSSVLRDCILRWPNAQIIDLLCSYMNPLPDDVRGLSVKKNGLSAQTLQKLKFAGCKVKMF